MYACMHTRQCTHILTHKALHYVVRVYLSIARCQWPPQAMVGAAAPTPPVGKANLETSQRRACNGRKERPAMETSVKQRTQLTVLQPATKHEY